MLPPEAKTYFDSLWSSASADAWVDLDNRQKDFERVEFSRGHSPDGAGFSARLAALYQANLSNRARAIVATLETVHRSFHSPLGDGVDEQLLDWGTKALADAYQGLEGAYARHLQRFGVHMTHKIGWDQTYALAQVTVANFSRHYLWALRNVPAKRSEQPMPSTPTQVTIHNSGTIGSIQTGAGSTAYVQQHWIEGETSELQKALADLRNKLEQAPDVEPESRVELIHQIDQAGSELQQERPNKEKVLRWLNGIGMVIGTVGSVQPAYDQVKALARALGLPV